jgi:hypothetical protein
VRRYVLNSDTLSYVLQRKGQVIAHPAKMVEPSRSFEALIGPETQQRSLASVRVC